MADTPPWQDPQVNGINRLETRASYFAFETPEKALLGDKKQSSRYFSLEGMWKFNWVQNLYERPTDFYQVDFEDENWVDFPVPSPPSNVINFPRTDIYLLPNTRYFKFATNLPHKPSSATSSPATRFILCA